MATKEEEFLKKLRAAFAVEAEEHLQNMSSGLLELEKAPASQQAATLDGVYREAHSLKGAARAVNIAEIESVCQALESVFSAWKRRALEPSPDLFDTLHRALDLIAQLLAAPDGAPAAPVARLVQKLSRAVTSAPPAPGPTGHTLTGNGASPPAPHANGALSGGETLTAKPEAAKPEAAAPKTDVPSAQTDVPAEKSEAAKPAAEKLASAPAKAATPPEKEEPEAAPVTTVGARPADKAALPETVRIATAKLDALLLQAEEMLTLKLTAGQRAVELREVEGLVAEWLKRWAKLHPELRAIRQWLETEGVGSNGLVTTGTATRLVEFLDWSGECARTLESQLGALAQAAERDRRTAGGLVDNLLADAKKLLMLPFATLLGQFPRLVRDLARDQGKDVQLILHGGEVEIDKRILEEMKDPLIHLLRNSIDHGLEPPDDRLARHKPRRGTVTVAVSQVGGNEVEILITDDGRGLDVAAVKAAAVKRGLLSAADAATLNDAQAQMLIFQDDVSTSPIITEISGRGLGMAIVREKVEKLGGHVTLESSPGQGTVFRIRLPLTLATFTGILTRAAGQLFVIPISGIERVARLRADQIQTVENRDTIILERLTGGATSAGGASANSDAKADTREVVALAQLADVLELARPAAKDGSDSGFMPVVVLGAGDKRIAFRVDEVLSEQEVLVKPLGKPLARVRNVDGATVLGSGQAVPILNIDDLLKSALKAAGRSVRALATEAGEDEARAKTVLIAEDSITSRMLLKNILESAGYEVTTAVDGVDALTALRSQQFDVLVSDVDMPRMDGFTLTESVRRDQKLADLPVVLVTGRGTPEDRERGIDAGANAYIVKSSFDQSNLLDVIRRLV